MGKLVAFTIVWVSVASACSTNTPSVDGQKVTVGPVRVSLISDSIVRMELKGAKGFEDRETFHIVNRQEDALLFSTSTTDSDFIVDTKAYRVRIPLNVKSLEQIHIETAQGNPLYQFDGELVNNRSLPTVSQDPQYYSFSDYPRLAKPSWGITPAPHKELEHSKTNGWDLENDAADIYVILPKGDYRQLRTDFLRLTGHAPMPPLYAFGAWDSRWFNYSQQTALEQIEAYRSRQIPLDVLVVDTGWREGASIGYAPNKEFFPDVKSFLSQAHSNNARVMFNDHPEPRSDAPLSREELEFRFSNLKGLLDDGLDVWWYDRNWFVALNTPSPALRKEVWGMQMYNDITKRVRPDERPLIMANADGIDNGIRNQDPDVAAHRFTIQWSGDTDPGLDSLRRGVENCVLAGVKDTFAYLSEDLGGHTADPTAENYIRWIQYGALSPIYRPHGTYGLERMPWSFGEQAESIARRFLQLRYRLLPTFYAASRENYESGEPLLRRLDLDYPQYVEAQRNDQYLISKNILIAPIVDEPANPEGGATRMVWIPPGEWINSFTGEILVGPKEFLTASPIDRIPIFIRAGALVILAPQMQHTSEKPWSPVTLDIYPSKDSGDHAILYEDDGHSNGYERGEFRKTPIISRYDSQRRMVNIEIGKTQGDYFGAFTMREWILRVHKPLGWTQDLMPSEVNLNGRKIETWRILTKNDSAMPLGDVQGAPDGDVFEIALPSSSVFEQMNVSIQFDRQSY